MRIIYRAENQIDAYLVKDALEDGGIHAFVGGEYLQGGLGELPASGLITVSVADGDVGAALAIVTQFAAQTGSGEAETRQDHPSDSLLNWKG